MKILLRTILSEDEAEQIAKQLSISDVCKKGDIISSCEFNSDSEIFSDFLKITKDFNGFWFHPLMHFSDAEISKSRYFKLECRGKIIKETSEDYELNSSHLKNQSFIHTGGKFKIRIPDQIFFSKISSKSNSISCATEWMAEFVITSEIYELFKKSGLSGFDIRPIYNPKKGKNYTDYFQLYTESIMPMAEIDLSTPAFENPNEGNYRSIGCLTYDFKGDENIYDFNRTAEDWSNNKIPVWIVSSKVKECYKKNKLRGWAFQPVLEKGSDLHRVYIEKWNDLIKRISINPRNRL